MSSNIQTKIANLFVRKNPEPISEFDKMIRFQVWTSRLERMLQSRLNELKVVFNKLRINLHTVEKKLPENSEERALVTELRGYSQEVYQRIFPEIIGLQVKASDNMMALDAQLTEAKQRIAELESLNPGEKISRKIGETNIGKKVSNAINRVVHPESQSGDTKITGQAPWDPRALLNLPPNRYLKDFENNLDNPTANNYANIDNSGTAYNIFPSWCSVIHHDGQRYGSTQPTLTDHLQNLVEVHQAIPFSGKSVLEIGSFEGANTKQIANLGASKVIGIEANPEFYLKGLIVKNECKLDNVEFIFGDCNEVLANPEFRAENWFDICVASGVLYHMEDPLYLIDLLTATAPVIYIWTQVASDSQPNCNWEEICDGETRKYKAKRNVYKDSDSWGGVSSGAYWLHPDALLQAFSDRGFEPMHVKHEPNKIGDVLSFIARRKDVQVV